MINEVINYIRNEISLDLGINTTEIFTGNIHRLGEDNNSRGIYISLVNIEEESTLKNVNHVVRNNNNLQYEEPPVFLNLFLVIATNFSNYDTSLLRLAEILELFQSKPLHNAANERLQNPFPDGLEKLIFNVFNLNIETLNHLWGNLGSNYYPSILYKVRMVRIKKVDDAEAATPITTIRVDTNL